MYTNIEIEQHEYRFEDLYLFVFLICKFVIRK